MPTQRYDFVTGIETAAPPVATTPGAVSGDAFIIGTRNRFTLANNTGATDVTGAVWNKTLVRSVILLVTMYRSAAGGSTRSQVALVHLVNDGTSWDCVVLPYAAVASSGMDAGCTFTATAAGQLQVATDDAGGSYSADNSWLSWKVLDLQEVA